jgi:hypothetical protein
MASSRAARLNAIKAELMADHGYTADNISRTDRERIEHAALLKLQHEIVSGKLVEGGSVGTDELVRLTEAINAMLPAKVPKPIVVEYCDDFTETLRSMIEGAGKEGLATEIDSKLAARVSEMEGEIVQLNRVITELRAETERIRARAEPAVSAGQPATAQPALPPNTAIVGGVVVPFDTKGTGLIRPGQERGIWP